MLVPCYASVRRLILPGVPRLGLLCLPLLLPACEDPSGPPTLHFQVESLEDGQRLKASFTTSPKDAFRGVELNMDGHRLGTDTEAAFEIQASTEGFPDGIRTLTAIGLLWDGSELKTSQPYVLNRLDPALWIHTPLPAAPILPTGTSLIFEVEAQTFDGNGLAEVYLEVADERFSPLPAEDPAPYAGYQRFRVTLPQPGVVYPQPPLTVSLHATDGGGRSATLEQAVQPEVIRSSTEISAGYSTPGIRQLEASADGLPLFLDEAGGLYKVQDAAREASLTRLSSAASTTQPFVQQGDQVFFSSYQQATLWQQVSLDGELRTLRSLNQGASQSALFWPFLHSSGQVIGAWLDYGQQGEGILVTHLEAYDKSGKRTIDATLPGTSLSGEVVEASDGRLLTVTSSQTGAQTVVQPWDLETGEALPPWLPPQGVFAQGIFLQNATQVIVRSQGEAQSGPPASHLTAFDAITGTLEWDLALPMGLYPLAGWWNQDDEPRAFLASSSPDQPARIVALVGAEEQVLWEGEAGSMYSWLLTDPAQGILLVSFDMETAEQTLIGQDLDGEITWENPLLGALASGTLALPDGGFALVEGGAPAQGVLGTLAAGISARFPLGLSEVRGLGYCQGSLFAAGYLSDGKVFGLERHSLQDGSLFWRFEEPNTVLAYGQVPLLCDPALGMAWTAVPRVRLDAQGNPSNAYLLGGFAP